MPSSHLSEATLIRNAAIKAKYDFSNMTGEAIYNSFDDSALQVGYLAGDILKFMKNTLNIDISTSRVNLLMNNEDIVH